MISKKSLLHVVFVDMPVQSVSNLSIFQKPWAEYRMAYEKIPE